MTWDTSTSQMHHHGNHLTLSQKREKEFPKHRETYRKQVRMLIFFYSGLCDSDFEFCVLHCTHLHDRYDKSDFFFSDFISLLSCFRCISAKSSKQYYFRFPSKYFFLLNLFRMGLFGAAHVPFFWKLEKSDLICGKNALILVIYG